MSLPKVHGASVRAVVFGYIGARYASTQTVSVKMTDQIRVQQKRQMARSCQCYCPTFGCPRLKKEYLYYTLQAEKHDATYSNGFSIQDMPVASAIIISLDKAVVIHNSTITLRGWAHSGGGNRPERVEVNGDGGIVCYETSYGNSSQRLLPCMCLRIRLLVHIRFDV